MPKIDKEWTEVYFEQGVDVSNRRVWLVGDIDEESITAAIKGLYLMNSIGNEPCELFISSYGGDMVEAHALYDIINTVNCSVRTFAFGKCMSAAPLLLAAGEKGHRWVAPHAEFMAHDWRGMVEGKGVEMKADLEQGEKTNTTRLKLLAKHSCKTVAFWRGMSSKKTDAYFTAEDAIDWGLADHIWNERDGK